MKESELQLFLGRVEFADPSLLFSGDEQSLWWLAERIESREIAHLRQGQPTFFVCDQSITLIPVDDAGRLVLERDHYEWRIDARQARDFVERLRYLARSPYPAHAYLDTESPLQIIASLGEYDVRVFHR